MAPVVVEFDNPGNMQHASDHARRVAYGMTKAASFHPDKLNGKSPLYEPHVTEVCRIEEEFQDQLLVG